MMVEWSLKAKKMLLGLSASLVIAAVLGGCGFKTLPVAPQAVVPVAITDLRYELSEKGVTLFWSYPIETITGQQITDLDNFILYRAVVPADSYCDTCPIPFGKPIVLPGGALPGEGRKTGTYEATLLRPGNLYFFKIRSKSGWLAESTDSNLVQFIWQIPPKAPSGLTVEVKGDTVSLQWQPVTTHIDGTPVTAPVRYQVSRSVGGGAFENIGSLTTDTSAVDATAVTGRKYFYRIQALSVYDHGTVGGGLCDSVGATPVDLIPPAPPVDVKAVRTGAGVKIIWSPVEEGDLKGYKVYRRVSGGGGSVLIGTVAAPNTLYDDRKIPAGTARLFYSVSSFDKSDPANESDKSPEVMIKQ